MTLFGGIAFSALIVESSCVLDGIGVTSIGLVGAAAATAVGGAVFGRLLRQGLRRR